MPAFRQVDVFSSEPLLGNPVAVVHDADALTDEQMAAFARWTNLSETTFLLSPSAPGADYRVRIWTPGGELPFAGHPTLGSAHAWLEAGGAPASTDVVVQECPAGLVDVRREERLTFAAPPLVRSGPVAEPDLAHALRVLGLAPDDLVEAAWIDNGPGWMGLLVTDAETVLACRPDYRAFDDLKVGIVGPWREGAGPDGCAVEVRAFCPGYGPEEDPVTGSLNAGIGQWLGGRVLPSSYVAAQGTVLQRRGRVHVTRVDDVVWVGGDTRTTVVGTVGLGD
ncbi:PhzF family phenazine biosynthesis protein [Nocardioides plantarum]|uniref:PhzF family phenazine biosynthesis protein n=1 Tax=Nocardioides plantarum TaxID=29299 RepID=A0ABV5KAX9_9ACTN|nr:PhzF family phenazine biosynthesis protein [Nocardioides plantarum]